MSDWRTVYEFWFPEGLDKDYDTHIHYVGWWFRGGANAELPPFLPLVERAMKGDLNSWAETAHGRLSLILLLDQFPRGLFAGSALAFAGDEKALALTLEGIDNKQYEALLHPWERLFFTMPPGHTEGDDHMARADRIVDLHTKNIELVPVPLRPIYEFSLKQARDQREVVRRFGRMPHRNAVIGRQSTPEEVEYLAAGDFVHERQLPAKE